MNKSILSLSILLLFFSSTAHPAKDTLVVGGDFDYPPYTFIDINGNAAGLDIDILKELEKHLNVVFTFELTRWDTARARLEAGDIDLIAGIVYSEDREKLYSFSNPIHTMHYAAFGRKGLKVSNIHDLKNKKLLVLPGDIASENYLKSMGLLHHFSTVTSLPEAIHKIDRGIADFVMAPYSLGMEIIEEGQIKHVVPVKSLLLPSLYCLAVEKNNLQLLAQLNRGIDLLQSTGKLEEIYNSWIHFHPEEQTRKEIIRILLIASSIFIILLFFAIIWWHSLNQQVKKKTKEVKEKEENYLNIFNSNRDALFILDENGRIEDVNPVACCMFGCENKDLKKRLFSGFLQPDEQERFKKFLTRTVAGEETFVESFASIAEKISIPVDIKGALVHTQGKTQVLIIVRDISLKKKAENISINARLEAERANEAKSQFVSMVSHELKNPLHALMGFVNILQKRIDPDSAPYVTKIGDTAETMQCIIGQLLDLSKIESGKFELNKSYILVADVLKKVRNSTLHLKSKEVNYIFDVWLPPNLIIYADALRLYQVLTNFLSNALKYTQAGSVYLVVEPCNKVTSKNEVCLKFTITDSGTGLSQEELVQIFEPFYRAANKDNDQQGTGLGLSITRRFVEMMGGVIEADSEVGQGTSFNFSLIFPTREDAQTTSVKPDKRVFVEIANQANRHIILRQLRGISISAFERDEENPTLENDIIITDNRNIPAGQNTLLLVQSPLEVLHENPKIRSLMLPLITEELVEALIQNKTDEAQEEHEFGRLNGRRVLVVDDDLMNREFIEILLSNELAEVETAKNGVEAMGKATSQDFDCIVLDLNMPDIHGYALLKQLHNQKIYTPAIGLSAAEACEKERALAHGMADFLIKPADPDSLVNAIKDIIEEICAQEYYSHHHPVFISRGLKNFAGDRESFIKMLFSFMEKYADSPDSIKIFIETNDMESLNQLIHNLISVTGIIGALNFSSFSRKLFNLIKENQPPGTEKIENYLLWLRTIIAEVDSYLINNKNIANSV